MLSLSNAARARTRASVILSFSARFLARCSVHSRADLACTRDAGPAGAGFRRIRDHCGRCGTARDGERDTLDPLQRCY